MSCSNREGARRERHKTARLRAWESTGSLYSTRAEERLTGLVRAAFAKEFGAIQERTEPPGDVEEAIDNESVHTLLDLPAMTFAEIGAKLRLSPQRVQQIEAKALAKVRRACLRLGLAPRARR